MRTVCATTIEKMNDRQSIWLHFFTYHSWFVSQNIVALFQVGIFSFCFVNFISLILSNQFGSFIDEHMLSSIMQLDILMS